MEFSALQKRNHIIEQWIEKLDVTRKYPTMIIFDMTNVCNFDCPHCPQSVMATQPDYRASYLDFDIFCRIIDEIADTDIKFMRFTGAGEPMLHKCFMKMVEYAKQRTQIPLIITTNGSLMNAEATRRLLELPMAVIDVSLDAFTREKYEIVRKGGNYHQVIGNIHHLLYLRNKLKSPTKIMVNMISQQTVENEVEDFRRYWTPLVDFVLIRNLHSALKKVNQAEVGRNVAEKWADRYPCAHLWKRVTIDYSLNVKFCAHDWYDDTVISKLGKGGIKEIWFSDRMSEIRNAHLTGNYEQASICDGCPDWAAAPWDYGYEQIIEKLGVIAL